ncbi:MAG: transcription elongation factor GreA [Deltaproteobacteria bacterium]|nr:transcription elongation factor GreA [Deltaproteobacteria bacterium]
MERIPITTAGYDALKEKVRQLKEVERPDVIRAIQEARAHGDISENAEFEAAKERQAFVEGQIGQLQHKIAFAEVIDPATVNTDRVMFGCTVALENLSSGEEVTYQLVGADESDVKEGRISVSSPLGKAMIGKQIGDEIVVRAPAGERRFEIVEISAS